MSIVFLFFFFFLLFQSDGRACSLLLDSKVWTSWLGSAFDLDDIERSRGYGISLMSIQLYPIIIQLSWRISIGSKRGAASTLMVLLHNRLYSPGHLTGWMKTRTDDFWRRPTDPWINVSYRTRRTVRALYTRQPGPFQYEKTRERMGEGGGRPLRPIAPKRPRKALESFFVCRPRGCTDLYDASVCGVKAQTVAGSSLYIFLLPFLSCRDGADYSSGSFVALKLQSKLKGYSQTFIIGPCSRPFCLF